MRAPYRGTHSALLCAHTHRFVQTCPRCVHTLVPTIWIGAQLLSVYPSVCTPILAIPPCKHLATHTPTPVHAQPMHTHVLAPVHPPSTCCACTPMHVILLPTHSPLSRCAPLGTPSCPQRHPDPAPDPVAGAQHAPETSRAGGMKTFITDISFRVAN